MNPPLRAILSHPNGETREFDVIRVEQKWAIVIWPLFGEIWICLLTGKTKTGPRSRKFLSWVCLHLEPLKAARAAKYVDGDSHD